MKKLQTPLMLSALAASALLLQGCLGLATERILPNPQIPHRVAEETRVTVWARRPDGAFVKEAVTLQAGWWIAAPAVVE